MAVVVVALLVGCLAGTALAAVGKDAKKIYEEATAAFGLGRYVEAAEKYEAAFALRPDPALLYNAAQAFRLGGNKPRALELYRNYVRLYPDGSNANDARSHVAALKKDLEGPPRAAPLRRCRRRRRCRRDRAARAGDRPGGRATCAGAGQRRPDVDQLGRACRSAEPLTKKVWFWVAVGAGAACADDVVLLATRRELSRTDVRNGEGNSTCALRSDGRGRCCWLAAAALGGIDCSKQLACRPGTVFVNVDLGPHTTVTDLDVDVPVNGGCSAAHDAADRQRRPVRRHRGASFRAATRRRPRHHRRDLAAEHDGAGVARRGRLISRMNARRWT